MKHINLKGIEVNEENDDIEVIDIVDEKSIIKEYEDILGY